MFSTIKYLELLTTNVVRVTTFLLLFTAVAESAIAQENVLDSDPLRARKLLVYDQVGGYAGLSMNSQGGTLVTNCNCEFQGGASTGFVVGGLFERLTRSTLRWGVMLGYENRSIEGRFREIEGVVQRAPSNGMEYTVPVEFLNVADVSLGYLTATPYLKYTGFDLMFVRVGAALSYVVTSNLTHTKELVSDTVRFPNGESATVSLPDANGQTSVVLQDGPIEDLQQFQVGVAIAGGIDIKLSKSMYLSPVVQYIVPVTRMSSSVGGFSVKALQILAEMRVIL